MECSWRRRTDEESEGLDERTDIRVDLLRSSGVASRKEVARSKGGPFGRKEVSCRGS